ncbi:MAG: S4 domain-containing protein [Ruminococcus callidus]
MKEFCIQENDSDQRLDRFLQKTLPELPKSLCYKWIRTKHIKVNRKRCTPDQRLVTGDVVTLFVSDSYLQSRQRKNAAAYRNLCRHRISWTFFMRMRRSWW